MGTFLGHPVCIIVPEGGETATAEVSGDLRQNYGGDQEDCRGEGGGSGPVSVAGQSL